MEKLKRLYPLAEKIVAARRVYQPQEMKQRPYMLPIGHPALKKLYLDWRAGAPAPGDVERTAWELSLFNEDTLERIRAVYESEDGQ